MHARWRVQNNFCHCVCEGCFDSLLQRLIFSFLVFLIPISSLRIICVIVRKTVEDSSQSCSLHGWSAATMRYAHSHFILPQRLLTPVKTTISSKTECLNRTFVAPPGGHMTRKFVDVKIHKRCNKYISFASVIANVYYANQVRPQDCKIPPRGEHLTVINIDKDGVDWY